MIRIPILLCAALILFCSSKVYGQEEIVVPVAIEPDPTDEQAPIFVIVEEMPSYPGGEAALFAYLSEHIVYPDAAVDRGIQGVVYVSFVVEPDGVITQAKVLRGIGGGCDEEALRVIRQMPEWKPGVQRGKPVRVQYNLPIRFAMIHPSPALPTEH